MTVSFGDVYRAGAYVNVNLVIVNSNTDSITE